MTQINERVRALNDAKENTKGEYVLYWMQMFKRTDHNHALNFAIEKANEMSLPLLVYEGLKFYYPWANDRIHTFILEGVNEKRNAFKKKGISYVFYLQRNKKDPKKTVARLASKAALLVTDDYPCFIIPEHNKAVAEQAKVPVYAADSNGIIPMSRFDKEEYAAYTIRPKIRKMLPDHLVSFKEIVLKKKNPSIDVRCPDTVFKDSEIPAKVSECDIDHSVAPSPIYKGGTANARARLRKFVKEILPTYHKTRNKPEIDGSSRLSSYLHFGFISSLEVALAVEKADAPEEAKEAYLEELIVRRELSFNFTRFNDQYGSLASLPDWAQQTMREHIADERPELYTAKEMETAATGDELWNAAQKEMLATGEMHNYVRMLWGKNVIGWSETYEKAFELLVDMNNKYCLDGRDPNSYAGILWCFGKHDRPWFERTTFGKIRYMASHSTGKKFDSKAYIEWADGLEDDPELPPTPEKE